MPQTPPPDHPETPVSAPAEGALAGEFSLGVVIVNYRTPALVEACLASLAPMLAAADAGVVVVDNASGDGSLERLAGWCAAKNAELGGDDRLCVLASPDNRGFSAGNNIGAAGVSSRYLLFLNSDALATPGALAALIDAAQKSPEVGVYAPRIVSSAGVVEVSRFRRHSPLGEFVDGAQSGPVTRAFSAAEVPIFPDDRETDPDWVSFAAVMIDRRAWDKTGPMDEGFFLYYEDCDYGLRLAQGGYSIEPVDDAVFVHDAGGSTQLREKAETAARLPAYYYRARARYFRKYYGPLGPVAANLAWYAGRAIAHLRGVFGRRAPTAPQARGRDIWIGWLN